MSNDNGKLSFVVRQLTALIKVGGLWLGLFDTHRLRAPLFGFVNVFDVALENQKVRRRSTIDLQRPSIVPLNCSFDLFAIIQDQHHRSVSVDLLFVIVDFGMRLRRRRLTLAYLNRRWLWPAWLRHSSAALHTAVSLIALVCYFSPGFYICERGSNKFAIHNSASKEN